MLKQLNILFYIKEKIHEHKIKKLKNILTKENLIVLSIISVISLILFYCLILTPAIVKADNGDFGRMYG